MSNDPSKSNAASPVFATTQWTRVLEARGASSEAKAALGDLCAAYYQPVFTYVRNHAPDDETARDLTQEFFARLLSRSGIDSVDPNRGRFRSFLLGAVKHYLSDARDHANRVKRGGGQQIESLDASENVHDFARADSRGPDQEFDRKWALTVLDRALAALAAEHQAAGKIEQFERLKPWLTGDSGDLSQAEAAQALGLNEGALKVAIHRLRRRFRELVKAEIGQTLRDPEQIANELACLIAALNS